MIPIFNLISFRNKSRDFCSSMKPEIILIMKDNITLRSMHKYNKYNTSGMTWWQNPTIAFCMQNRPKLFFYSRNSSWPKKTANLNNNTPDIFYHNPCMNPWEINENVKNPAVLQKVRDDILGVPLTGSAPKVNVSQKSEVSLPPRFCGNRFGSFGVTMSCNKPTYKQTNKPTHVIR